MKNITSKLKQPQINPNNIKVHQVRKSNAMNSHQKLTINLTTNNSVQVSARQSMNPSSNPTA